MEKRCKWKCLPWRYFPNLLLRIELLSLLVLISAAVSAAGLESNPATKQNSNLNPGSQAQKKEITGSVKDAKGLPLPGVTIVVKGTSTGTTSASDGLFKLSVPTDAKILLFTFIGMKPTEVSLTTKSKFDIVMEEEDLKLEEVVVIGYGSIRKRDLTGAVGEVSVKDLNKAPVASFAEALAGRVAGVRVNAADGQPGGAINITIRGTGSLTQSTMPLYVIDGIAIENFDPLTLNQEEIQTMSVLKDASSTAIYGSRGANGVILIQTKRGSVGKPVVSFSAGLGYIKMPKSLDLMSPYEFVKYQTELNPTTASTTAFFGYDDTLGRFLTLDDYKNVKGVNFQDQLLQTGATQIYDISMRGGSEDTKYSVSGSYYDLKGSIINTGLSRYTGRVTLDQTISKAFSAGVTVNYSAVSQNGQIVNMGQAGQSQPTSFLLANAWMYRPVTPYASQDLMEDPYDKDAVTTSDIRVNPFLSQQNQHLINATNLFESSLYVDFRITKELVFRSTVGFRNNKYSTEAFYNSKTTQGSPYNLNNINGVNGSVKNTITNLVSNSNTLTFNKTFNNGHSLNVLGLFETSSNKVAIDGYGGRLLPNEVLGINGLEEGTLYNGFLSRSMSTLVSYGGRVDYNYKSKYLVSASYRADASSKFPQAWGYFPSGSMAWNMQNEPFFAKLFPGISNSKIRMSFGTTGNNRIGDFDYSPSMVFNNTTQGYAFNNANPNGAVYVNNVGNINLKWETIKNLDLGYELGLFKNRLTVEAGVYRRITSDLLLRATLPPTTGFASAMKNIGELQNDGLEITVNTFNVNTPKFKWQTNFNITFNQNKVNALTSGQTSLGSTVSYVSQFGKPLYLAEVGRPSGMMIGYIWDGNYQYADFNNPSPGIYVLKPEIPGNGAVRNTIQPGDIKYKDLNGDGTMSDADVTFIGRGQPIHQGGFSNNFSYKGFDLNVFFQWSYGNNIFNANRLLMEGNSNGWANINQFATYADRWSPTNPSNLYYRTRGQGPIGLFSSRTVEDGSYLRLKTVSLNYTVPARYIKKLYMSNLSFNVSAQNLLTWTNYSGMDPEVSTRGDVLTPGYDYSAYPKSPTVVFGVKVSF